MYYTIFISLHLNDALKTQKNQFNTELVSACPATSYSHRGVSPNYHRR